MHYQRSWPLKERGRKPRLSASAPGSRKAAQSQYSLSEPLVTLHVVPTDPEQSKLALDCLMAVDIGFSVRRGELVAAAFGGTLYEGVSAIHAMADVLRRANDVLMDDADPMENRTDIEVDPRVRASARQDLTAQQQRAVTSFREIMGEEDSANTKVAVA